MVRAAIENLSIINLEDVERSTLSPEESDCLRRGREHDVLSGFTFQQPVDGGTGIISVTGKTINLDPSFRAGLVVGVSMITAAQRLAENAVGQDSLKVARFNYKPTEIGLIKHIADGLSNPDIADQLGWSISLVKLRISELFQRENVTNHYELVIRAVQKGIL